MSNNCALCMFGHANHSCDNDLKVTKDDSEEDGSIKFYGKWFSVHNPYFWNENKYEIDIDWEGYWTGYDGLTKKTYDQGQETLKWAKEKYANLLGINKPILSTDEATKIVIDTHIYFYDLKNSTIER